MFGLIRAACCGLLLGGKQGGKQAPTCLFKLLLIHVRICRFWEDAEPRHLYPKPTKWNLRSEAGAISVTDTIIHPLHATTTTTTSHCSFV